MLNLSVLALILFLGFVSDGVFQDSCRIFCFIRPKQLPPIISMSNCFQSYQAAFSQLSGLRTTSRISDQSRVLPDQRLGFSSLACS